MEIYTHRAQYYETDKMGVVHHSNYIRWYEEARLDFMDKIGIPYKTLEDMGLICPVLSVKSTYKKSVYFDDTVKVYTKLTDFGNVRHTFSYTICDLKTGETKNIGETTHCFLDASGRVISLKKKNPELFDKLSQFLE